MTVTAEETVLGQELSGYLAELESLSERGVREVRAVEVMDRLLDICIETRTSVSQLPRRTQEILQKTRQLSEVPDYNDLCGKEPVLLRLVTRHLRESLVA